MPIHLLLDSDDETMPMGKPFGRERPIYDILGRGKGLLFVTKWKFSFDTNKAHDRNFLTSKDQKEKNDDFAVADVLLWRDKTVSAAILASVSIIWFLFEVVEYNLVTLLSHIIITTMLVIFIWSRGADVFKWTPPRIPDIILHESSSREVAAIWHAKFNKFLTKFFDVACGNDFRQFILGICSLWILSVAGNYISTMDLLFFSCLCLETLPYLYERYEEQVDHHLIQLNKQMRKSFKKLDSEFLRKVPRGPVKEKKAK